MSEEAGGGETEEDFAEIFLGRPPFFSDPPSIPYGEEKVKIKKEPKAFTSRVTRDAKGSFGTLRFLFGFFHWDKAQLPPFFSNY